VRGVAGPQPYGAPSPFACCLYGFLVDRHRLSVQYSHVPSPDLFRRIRKRENGAQPAVAHEHPVGIFFCVYAALVNAVESNKLFDREQSQFLKNNYQSAEFPYSPDSADEEGAGMYVVSVFRQTVQVELAVTALEQEGIPKMNLLAVPIEKKSSGKKLFDSMYSATGGSVFDLPMILGAFTALLGCVYGFVLEWGPVVWGVIGGVGGFGIGFFIKLLVLKKRKKAGCDNEVVIFVACGDNKTEQIRRIFSDNGALGTSIIKGRAD